MLRTLDTNREFEAIARAFLSKHPEIPHEWRQIPEAWWGGRTDVVCYPGEAREVFASVTETQITVGSRKDETDFEESLFQRGMMPNTALLAGTSTSPLRAQRSAAQRER